MIKTIRNLLKDETGATMIEYGLIAALISVAAVGILGTVGTNLGTVFTNVSNALAPAA